MSFTDEVYRGQTLKSEWASLCVIERERERKESGVREWGEAGRELEAEGQGAHAFGGCFSLIIWFPSQMDTDEIHFLLVSAYAFFFGTATINSINTINSD